MNQRTEPRLADVLPLRRRRGQEIHADSHPLPPRPAVPNGGPRNPEPPRLALVEALAA
jgi:hypothetical protein